MTMRMQQLDLITTDVLGAVDYFDTVLGLPPKVAEQRFAEIDVGGFTLLLSPADPPTKPARGVILHLEVDDVDAATERARGQGIAILREPASTDWATYSAWIAGPEESVIDLYREVA